MRFRPIGIARIPGQDRVPIRPSDYNDKIYDGICCGYDERERPVVIMCGRRDDPLRWKVIYGFSTVFFKTFREAMDFCRSRNMTMTMTEGPEDA